MPAPYPVYATVDDLANCGCPPRALQGITPSAQQQALAQASRYIDSRIAARYLLPLTAWDQDLIFAAVSIAVYRLLGYRGWNPDDPSNGAVVMNYRMAMDWVRDVANGSATMTVGQTTPDPVAMPDLDTHPQRGYEPSRYGNCGGQVIDVSIYG